ncbi:hypothetical protein [Sphingobacterium sp. IITKGP-BTPF85]|uniref:hypothetical protein n=1 Tax=Sphingobacterium sp. IITKGP-BTPF85 TaxID=1338009 RepID=UPI00038A14FD|nr:hypothetical protein [Sphingobacterium sp. IITKGP-BTPF85]KKX48474.1 hypothetical protein L950_0220785 [Sphingobacterium sp. IITKGP-BTPF85]
MVDNEKVAAESKSYQANHQKSFLLYDEHDEDKMKKQIESNYRQIKSDVLNIVQNEMERIKNDPNLQHLFSQ